MTSLDAARLRRLYQRARSFLLRKIPGRDGDAATILDLYLTPPNGSGVRLRLPQLYQSMLFSAQNANMKAGVIGGSIGGIANLGIVLGGFDPFKVGQTYGDDAAQLLSRIVEELKPRGQVRQTSRSLWPKYCQTILSAAAFFRQFSDGDAFYAWANHFYPDIRSRAALPMILAEEIYGVGYPLACDFLKELGFVDYGKPDVHIKDIFIGVGLCHPKTTDYEYQKIIGRIADANDTTAYNVDKLFWLIGSGNFYLHAHLGKRGHIGRNKAAFLAQLAGSPCLQLDDA